MKHMVSMDIDTEILVKNRRSNCVYQINHEPKSYCVFFFCIGVSCLKCYDCQGKSCPDDLSTFNKTVNCTQNQECVSAAIYKNDKLDLMNRMCRDKAGCLNSCSQKTGANNEQTCIFCCATDLCNTNTPNPNAARVLQSPLCLLLLTVFLVLSVILFKD